MENFGEFVRTKRKNADITLREMAVKLKYSATFWSDVENQKRNPPDIEKLEEVASILNLNEDDKAVLFDLAGKAENITPPDLTEYILEKPLVRKALRTAKKNASDDEWRDFINSLERK